MNMEEKNIRHILWTGGWDSTYRIVELSMQEITVEPIYVRDPGRKSSARELKAMNNILEALEKKENTKANFLPIRIIELSDIPENKEVTKAYYKFKEEAEMGSQHDWLARLALQFPGMELCIEKGLSGHLPVRQSIQTYGGLLEVENGFIINPDISTMELKLVLGNFVLPIFDKTELDMKKNIMEWGYEDVMSLIWFCHTPIKGEPCGLCNPCQTKMTSKMEFILPECAIKRNKKAALIERILGKKVGFVYRRVIAKVLCRKK